MDWRHNQWVGVGAAVLVVAGIVGIFTYVSKTGPQEAESSGVKFVCESTGETFAIRDKEFNDFEVFKTYHQRPEEGLPCRVCGKDDAYWAYPCQECKEFYRHKKGDDMRDTIICPKGHIVEESW